MGNQYRISKEAQGRSCTNLWEGWFPGKRFRPLQGITYLTWTHHQKNTAVLRTVSPTSACVLLASPRQKVTSRLMMIKTLWTVACITNTAELTCRIICFADFHYDQEVWHSWIGFNSIIKKCKFFCSRRFFLSRFWSKTEFEFLNIC